MKPASSLRTTTDWIAVATIVLAMTSLALLAGYAYIWFAYLFLNRWPSQEQMVPSGYATIPQAKPSDHRVGPAWHEVANFREPDRGQWITTALFGGRYELEMFVDVRIDRRSRKLTEVMGEPRFLLKEVEK